MPVINAFLAMPSSSLVRGGTIAQELHGSAHAGKVSCKIVILGERLVSSLPKFRVRSKNGGHRFGQLRHVLNNNTTALVVCQTLVTRIIEGNEGDAALHVECHFFG